MRADLGFDLVGRTGFEPVTSSVSGNVVGCSCFRILLMRCGKWSADVHGRMPPPRAVVTRLVTRRAWPLAWPSPSGPVHRWIGQQIGIYGRSMARRDPDSDRRPACSACAAGQIYDRSARIRRAAVRVGICREPYLLNLCELIWPDCKGFCPKAECGLSSSINRAALRLRVQFDSTTELLPRRSFHATGQPAHGQIRGRSRCPWLTAGHRSFPPVLARTWHAACMPPATRANRSVSPGRQLIGRMPVPQPGWLHLLFHSGRRGRGVQRTPLPETGNLHTTQVD